jgi:hypothetical protein
VSTAAPGIDERHHDTALRALLKPALNDHVYNFGDVPGADGNDGELPDIYAVVHLERRTAPVGPAGLARRSGWRIYVRCVGRTVKEARWALKRATNALEGVRIEVDDIRSTPLAHDSSDGVRPDDGRQSGLVEFTYVL